MDEILNAVEDGDQVSPRAMMLVLRQLLDGAHRSAIRTDGDLASMHVQLPSGQTFTITIEETTGR